MCNHLGLEDGELTLAEIVWEKAERAMQGKPVQEAALLKEPYVIATKQTTNELTREEAQFLSGLVRDFLGTAQSNMKVLRRDIQDVWLLCDPNDKATDHCFEELNELRTYQRKINSSLRKLESVQHKLKKQR
jgi:hypothetical protein